jgi:hypothetical protein
MAEAVCIDLAGSITTIFPRGVPKPQQRNRLQFDANLELVIDEERFHQGEPSGMEPAAENHRRSMASANVLNTTDREPGTTAPTSEAHLSCVLATSCQ